MKWAKYNEALVATNKPNSSIKTLEKVIAALIFSTGFLRARGQFDRRSNLQQVHAFVAAWVHIEVAMQMLLGNIQPTRTHPANEQ